MGEFLRCDAEGCDYVEDVNKITDHHVDMPCPKCGANLLTAQDWENWKPLQALMAALDEISASATEVEEKVAVRVGLHGQKTTIEFDRDDPKTKGHRP